MQLRFFAFASGKLAQYIEERGVRSASKPTKTKLYIVPLGQGIGNGDIQMFETVGSCRPSNGCITLPVGAAGSMVQTFPHVIMKMIDM